MTASEKFEKGRRVVATAAYRRQFRPPYEGVVVKFARLETLVYVRKDGQKWAGTYHLKFWEPAADAAPAETPTGDGPARAG
jgi:hypothetical protein